MKLLITFFLTIAVNYVLSSPTNPDEIHTFSKPVGADSASLGDSNRAGEMELISCVLYAVSAGQSAVTTVTINGDLDIQTIFCKHSCCNHPQQVDCRQAIFDGAVITPGSKTMTINGSVKCQVNLCNRRTNEDVATAQTVTSVTINGNVRCKTLHCKQTCRYPNLPYGYKPISQEDGYLTGAKLYTTKRQFNDARKTCAHEGAFLAYAANQEEEFAFLRMMRINSVFEIWTGIHDLFQQHDWSTILGEIAQEVAYFRWRPGQPDNAGGNERCTHFRRDGLNDIPCDHQYAYFCKIKVPCCSQENELQIKTKLTNV